MRKLTEEYRQKSAETLKKKYPDFTDEVRLQLVDDYWWWYNQGVDETTEKILTTVLRKMTDKETHKPTPVN